MFGQAELHRLANDSREKKATSKKAKRSNQYFPLTRGWGDPSDVQELAEFVENVR